MSRKRTSAEYNDDDQANEVSDPLQRVAKRAKLVPSSDTTLQDLPNELLADILAKAVVMEVKNMRLAKSVWKEKADLAIRRLRTVCSPWNNILDTNFLRNSIHGILDGTAKEKFRLVILHQSQIESFVRKIVTLKDEMFMLCRPVNQEPFINVHNRNNMEEVKDIIPLTGTIPVDIAVCSVSNCLFVLDMGSPCRAILRITRDEEHQFKISPWVNAPNLPFVSLFVGINGRLIVLSREDKLNPAVISIYEANGTLQHAITLFPAIHGITFIASVLQKANGNLIVVYGDEQLDINLNEIDVMGRIVRQYRSSMIGLFGVNVVDAYGRIWIADLFDAAELLDSEFNLLDLTCSQEYVTSNHFPLATHYDIDRNEIVCRCFSVSYNHNDAFLTIYRVTIE